MHTSHTSHLQWRWRLHTVQHMSHLQASGAIGVEQLVQHGGGGHDRGALAYDIRWCACANFRLGIHGDQYLAVSC